MDGDKICSVYLAIIFSPVLIGWFFNRLRPKRNTTDPFEDEYYSRFKSEVLRVFWESKERELTFEETYRKIFNLQSIWMGAYPHNRKIRNYHIESKLIQLNYRWKKSKGNHYENSN